MKKPRLYDLTTDVSEEKNLTEEKAEQAAGLHARWKKWDESNIDGRLMGYKHYHRERDKFFREAIPPKAKKAGYPAKEIPTFK